MSLEFQDIEDLGTHGSGVSHGGFGRSSLQECLDRLNQARADAPAPCHSGVENEDSSNPPQTGSQQHGKPVLFTRPTYTFLNPMARTFG